MHPVIFLLERGNLTQLAYYDTHAQARAEANYNVRFTSPQVAAADADTRQDAQEPSKRQGVHRPMPAAH